MQHATQKLRLLRATQIATRSATQLQTHRGKNANSSAQFQSLHIWSFRSANPRCSRSFLAREKWLREVAEILPLSSRSRNPRFFNSSRIAAVETFKTVGARALPVQTNGREVVSVDVFDAATWNMFKLLLKGSVHTVSVCWRPIAAIAASTSIHDGSKTWPSRSSKLRPYMKP